jgi:hypothetical protein
VPAALETSLLIPSFVKDFHPQDPEKVDLLKILVALAQTIGGQMLAFGFKEMEVAVKDTGKLVDRNPIAVDQAKQSLASALISANILVANLVKA